MPKGTSVPASTRRSPFTKSVAAVTTVAESVAALASIDGVVIEVE